ncbi:hypothetical protein MRB53_039834 [Persea americana]|nr:hypothetical protein MRB53_039834 [Persea americana]
MYDGATWSTLVVGTPPTSDVPGIPFIPHVQPVSARNYAFGASATISTPNTACVPGGQDAVISLHGFSFACGAVEGSMFPGYPLDCSLTITAICSASSSGNAAVNSATFSATVVYAAQLDGSMKTVDFDAIAAANAHPASGLTIQSGTCSNYAFSVSSSGSSQLDLFVDNVDYTLSYASPPPPTPLSTTTTTTGTVLTTVTTRKTIMGTPTTVVVVEDPLPTIPCTRFGYLVQGGTSLYQLDLETGDSFLLGGALGTNVNAMGYNVLDGYLYAVDNANGHVIRIGATAATEVIVNFPPSYFDTAANAGDVTTSGQFFYMQVAAGSTLTRWSQIDLNPRSSTYGNEVASGVSTLPKAYFIVDWVYLPASNLFYTVATTYGETLLSWSPVTHVWTVIKEYQPSYISDPKAMQLNHYFGALFGVNNGSFYALDNLYGDIYRFDSTGVKAPVFVESGPAATSNQEDGARCVTNLVV